MNRLIVKRRLGLVGKDFYLNSPTHSTQPIYNIRNININKQTKEIESKTNPSTSNSNPSQLSQSIEKLKSSFQEPLVGLSPPLVEDGNHQPNDKPSPISSTQNNPATSLVTRSTTNEFKVLPHHPFHTHRFIKNVKNSKFSPRSASEILNHVENCLRSSERRWLLTGPNGGIVSKSYVEGQAYLYNAALSELRTEVQVKARNDSIVLKSTANSIQREIDNLNQKLKEDINNLTNSLQLEFNSRKEESSDGQKKLELAIQELNSKFTISVGEVRTEIETRKWVTTRRCVVAIASLALCVIIFTALENQQPSTTANTASLNTISNEPHHPHNNNPKLSSSNPPLNRPSSRLSQHSLNQTTGMRSVEELGISADLDNFDSD